MKNVNEIIYAISKDDRKAFNRFYDIYYDQVFHFAFYFTKDTKICKEIVSEVFFSAWISRARICNIINIETWLYVLTRNKTVQYYKAANRFISVPIEDDIKITAALHEREGDPTPEEQMLDKEIEELLTKVINTLPEKCKVIFIMARYDGLKPKEIAEILSISESTVRVQMKLATEKIIEGVKPHFPNISFILLLKIIIGG